MSLSTSWTLYFDTQARMRGRASYAEQRVQAQPTQPGELFRAEVEGEGGPFIVSIHESGEPEDAHCTCPAFAEGNYCEHLWAALLHLEHHGGALAAEVEPSADEGQRLPKARRRTGDRTETRRGEPEWMSRLNLVRTGTWSGNASEEPLAIDFMQVCYVVDPELCRQRQQLVIELYQRRLGAQGWSRLKRLKLEANGAADLPEPVDRELCSLLIGADWVARQNGVQRNVGAGEYVDIYDTPRTRSTYAVSKSAWWMMLRRFIDTGRCFIAHEHGEEPLLLDDEPHLGPWVLWLVGERTEIGLEVTVELRRGDQRMSIDRPNLVLGGAEDQGIVIYDGKAARFDDRNALRWVTHFRDDVRKYGEVRPIIVPEEDIDRFIDRLYLLADLPEIDFPEGVGRGEQHVELTPHMELTSPPPGSSRKLLSAQVWFEYGPHRVQPGQRGRFVVLSTPGVEQAAYATALPMEGNNEEATPVETGPLIRRDLHREQQLYASLLRAGFHPGAGSESDRLLISVKRMPVVVSQLLAQGWQIVADQRVLRRASAPKLTISSGIDWFELRGSVTYETETGVHTVDLPRILQAVRAGHTTVKLDDGSEGLLPQEWLAEHGLLTAMGRLHDDHLRFRSSQAALLDALLSRQEQVDIDTTFAAAREKLRRFDGIQPLQPAPTFQGTLRPYQCDGLGWFAFLRWFGMGGILADDMGLGKTIQILAMLDARYNGGEAPGSESRIGGAPNAEATDAQRGHRPTLIVVPRSVIFNWIDEAQRFAPRLRVQAYTGGDRHNLRDTFADHDVIVTSYGLLRRDIDELRKFHFDYVVLDEAQAIKNPQSQSAKAARLLQADHRLALTGTPVENHIGDLWSIFEFLNPGMLGSSTRFAELVRHGLSGGGAAARQTVTDINVGTQIARALRPFILRRTKKQVLKELPEKTEQTIHCQMDSRQRAVYDELRAYFRQTLLTQFSRVGGDTPLAEAGGSGSPMLVLEALLRLRQAACHPALIDPKHNHLPSAKMEVLLDRLSDLVDEGHKALVFSQFTSMLSLVRQELDARGIRYAYLDGQTRKRKQVVDRFQNDPDCPIFLISLKAGGFGLNLTAAEYVFILDPWWNPAVEAQAIDRTHRIGQTRHVFAYRLICQDTVEQRILELQQRKKRLADALIGGQENLLRNLTRDDLERLLS